MTHPLICTPEQAAFLGAKPIPFDAAGQPIPMDPPAPCVIVYVGEDRLRPSLANVEDWWYWLVDPAITGENPK